MNNHLQNPLISVIVAFYNPGSYLTPCLDSIVNQTYSNLEIILVDDGSKDSSLQICNNYAKNDERIKVLCQENKGVSSARNLGLTSSTGEFISIIDSDDYLELQTYQSLVDILNKHDPDIIFFEHFITYSNREIAHKVDSCFYGLLNKEQAMRTLFETNGFAWSRLFSRRSIHNLFFENNIYRGEDGLFVMNAVNNAQRIYFTSKAFYHYVQSEQSAVRGKFNQRQLTGLQSSEIGIKFIKEKFPKLLGMKIQRHLNRIMTLRYDMFKSNFRETKIENKMSIDFKKYFFTLQYNEMISIKRLSLYILFIIHPLLYCNLRKILFLLKRAKFSH